MSLSPVCIFTESGYDLTVLSVTLIMIGKFAMTASFGTVILYAPEIYPTNLRFVISFVSALYGSELSMGWVDPWVGLGWVEIFQFLVGWVGATTEKVLKI